MHHAVLLSAGYSFTLINSVVPALVTAVLVVNLLLVLAAVPLLQRRPLLSPLLLHQMLSYLQMVNVALTAKHVLDSLVDLCHVVPLLDG